MGYLSAVIAGGAGAPLPNPVLSFTGKFGKSQHAFEHIFDVWEWKLGADVTSNKCGRGRSSTDIGFRTMGLDPPHFS